MGGGGKAKRVKKRSKYEKNITTCARKSHKNPLFNILTEQEFIF